MTLYKLNIAALIVLVAATAVAVMIRGRLHMQRISASNLVSKPAHGYPKGKLIEGLRAPENLVLYSLDGADEDNETKYREALASGAETLGHYAVLGKLPIADQKARSEIVAMLQDAIINHEGYAGVCFLPRHAIVAREKGRRFEIIICFQCRFYKADLDGQTVLVGSALPFISPKPEIEFNQLLTGAGIAIAP